jgi:hypothetical protein
MKPIAQSFLVSQPDTGIDGVFLTKISVYFKRVSSTFGISMEIRTVENGFPTANAIAGGRYYLSASQVVASDTGTVATDFIFDSLPFLQSNVQYAFVLVPDGGNDEYLVWTAQLGGIDVATNAPIYTNNQLGNLFISSNDLVFTPVITESIKYDLYTANFTSSSANVYLRPMPTDFVKINSTVGSFLNKERVWVSNSQYTSANVTSNSTSVRVPNSSISDLAVNNWIYIASSDRSQFNIRKVTNNTTNSTTIIVNSNVTFTNTSCIFGRIAGDGALYATVKQQLRYSTQEDVELVLVGTTSNSSLNFANTKSQLIFGLSSNASANIAEIANKQYDSITPHINFISPAQTAFSVAYSGYSNSGVKDSSYSPFLANLPNEFLDYERKVYSRSNEVANVSIGANSTTYIRADLSTSNNMTAPFIDRLDTSLTFTFNAPTSESQLLGYHLNLANVTGSFLTGDTLYQNSNTIYGIIDFANSSYIRVISTNAAFTNTSVLATPSGASANVTASTYFDETLENGYWSASRYISKNVILADKQDAEDLVSYLTIYRPVGTQFKVYGKFLNGSDPDAFSSKDWSLLPELDVSSALFSSAINREDVIEAQFGMPSSVLIDSTTATTNSSSSNVTVFSTAQYVANTYIYLKDNTVGSGAFNVRKISSVANSSTLTLSKAPSFTSTNVTSGSIPNLQSQSGAFLYANNNNILRYVTSTDVVYDSYKTFAIKIVPISNNSILVPIMKNMRCLALQV